MFRITEYYELLFFKFLKMIFQILRSLYYFGLASCHSYIRVSVDSILTLPFEPEGNLVALS